MNEMRHVSRRVIFRKILLSMKPASHVAKINYFFNLFSRSFFE